MGTLNNLKLVIYLFLFILHLVSSSGLYAPESLDTIKIKRSTEVQESDETYKKATGKTREELIKSGEYYPIDLFINEKNKDMTEGRSNYLKMTISKEKQTELEIRRGMAPRRFAVQNTHFDLYTLDNPRVPVRLTQNVDAVRGTKWALDSRLKILIHGLYQNGRTAVMPIAVKDAYMRAGFKGNVICIDWGVLADGSVDYYTYASVNTFLVGQLIAEFLQFLKQNGLISSYKSVHIVGFSLGAHVAGVAGRHVQNLDRELVSRITGLDPAGPGFGSSLDVDRRLERTDADFVDIIHTNMGNLNPFSTVSFGTDLVIGHVDFYPNGGSTQPNCGGFFTLGSLIGTCSHSRSPQLFAQSIEGKSLRGCRCNSWDHFRSGQCSCAIANYLSKMGEFCDPSTRGLHYLST